MMFRRQFTIALLVLIDICGSLTVASAASVTDARIGATNATTQIVATGRPTNRRLWFDPGYIYRCNLPVIESSLWGIKSPADRAFVSITCVKDFVNTSQGLINLYLPCDANSSIRSAALIGRINIQEEFQFNAEQGNWHEYQIQISYHASVALDDGNILGLGGQSLDQWTDRGYLVGYDWFELSGQTFSYARLHILAGPGPDPDQRFPDYGCHQFM